MIERIGLKNFKCFPQLELNFADLTVLTGANASGKSSIIQAILLGEKALVSDEKTLDASSALGINIGNPQSLIAQNAIELEKGNFEISLTENLEKREIYYFIDKYSPLKLMFEKNGGKIDSRIFYLNAERMGPRISYPAISEEQILSNGANAAYLIDRADLEGKKIPSMLSVDFGKSKFSVCVEEWMNVILGDVNLTVSTDLERGSTDVRYGNEMVDQAVLPTMTGFGISYILSIVTAGLWCAAHQNYILIVENPEAHLHPSAQSNMGKFLELISKAGVQVIVETHSEHIIDGIRAQAACLGNTESVEIYFFYAEGHKVKTETITLNQNGELSKWPQGFFDQKSLDLRQLFEIRRKNAGR